jgi:adenosine deaminase
MVAAYGTVPPTRDLVERFRRGDEGVVTAFEEIFVFEDADAGSFDRFQAKGMLWACEHIEEEAPHGEPLPFTATIRDDLARQGIAYAEIRSWANPNLLATFDVAADPPVERLAVSLSRDDPWPEWEQVIELALGPHGRALTGIDFCSVEEGYPPKAKADFFAEVLAFNDAHPDRALAILYHVGESFSDKSLESAVRWVHEAAEFGAHRLGHAIALGLDPRFFGEHRRHESVAERRNQIAYDLAHSAGLRAYGVQIDEQALSRELSAVEASADTDVLSVSYDADRLADVRRRQDYAMSRVRAIAAVIEVCPTSNRRTAGIVDPSDHPVQRFLDAGIATVVSSDDPGSFGTTLADELDWVCRHTGRGDEVSRDLIETAWRSRSECVSGRSQP